MEWFYFLLTEGWAMPKHSAFMNASASVLEGVNFDFTEIHPLRGCLPEIDLNRRCAPYVREPTVNRR